MTAIRKIWRPFFLALAVSAGTTAGLMPTSAMSQSVDVALDGSQEVPPVTTSAAGRASIDVSSDKIVTGTITTSGIDAKAAHIHSGAPGVSGPVIIPFVKTADNTWVPKAGAILSDEQYKNYMDGNLYINVHSAAYPDGEIRGRLKPI